MGLTRRDWAVVQRLRQEIAAHGAELDAAATLWAEYRYAGTPAVRAHTSTPSAFAALDDAAMDAVFETLNDVLTLMMDCNPRALLALGHGPGPDLGEECKVAAALAEALLPDVSDAVWRAVHGRYMFLNR